MNKYSLESILSLCKDFIDLSEFNLNIVGVRNHHKKKNIFNDTICVIINIDRINRYFEFNATTKATVDGFVYSSRIENNVMMMPGFYKNFWKCIRYEDDRLHQSFGIDLMVSKIKEKSCNVDKFSLSSYETLHGIDLKAIKYKQKATGMAQMASQYLERESDMISIIRYADIQVRCIGKRFISYLLIEDIYGKLVLTNNIYGDSCEESV